MIPSLRESTRLATLAACLLGALPAWALPQNVVTSVAFKNGNVEIAAQAPPNFTTFTMSDPNRLVVDISNAVFKGVAPDQIVNQGPVTSIKTVAYGAGASAVARVLIGFAKEVDTDLATSGNTLVVKIAGGQAVAAAEPAPAAAPPPAAEPPPAAPPPAAPPPAAAPPPPAPEPVAAVQPPPQPSAPVAQNDQPPPVSDEPPPTSTQPVPAPAPMAAPQQQPMAAAPPPEPAPQPSAPMAQNDQPPPTSDQPPPTEEAPIAQPAPQAPMAPGAQQPAPAAGNEQPPPTEGMPPPTEGMPPPTEAPASATAVPPPAQSAVPPSAYGPGNPAPPPEGAPVDVSRRTKRIALVGFRASDSQVFIRTNEPVSYNVSDGPDGSTVLVTIENTRIVRRNDRRAIDAHYFPTPVAQIQARQVRKNVVVEIRLKSHAPYRAVQRGQEVELNFTNGSVSSVEFHMGSTNG